MLRLDNISCQRGNRLLLAGVSARLEPGAALKLSGPNGIGKSSLLNVLIGLAEPEAGRVLWDDCELAEVADFNQQLCFIGHQPGVSAKLSALDNLRYYCAAQLQLDSEGLAEEALQRLGILEFADRLVGELSAGQQRRVALARLILSKAKLWVLDEPYASLDTAGQALLNTLLQQHLATGGMLVLTAHHAINLGEHPLSDIDLSQYLVSEGAV